MYRLTIKCDGKHIEGSSKEFTEKEPCEEAFNASVKKYGGVREIMDIFSRHVICCGGVEVIGEHITYERNPINE